MIQENKVEKKAKKTVVIALALICVILAASLVGVVAFYQLGSISDLQAQLKTKDATIASMNQTIIDQQNSLGSTNASNYIDAIKYMSQELSDAQNAAAYYADQLSYYENISTLGLSGELFSEQGAVQAPNTNNIVYSGLLDWAGYVTFQATSNSSTTFVEVSFNDANTNFDFKQTIGTSGNATFLVLPTLVDFKIGNLETTNNVNVTYTITYYY